MTVRSTIVGLCVALATVSTVAGVAHAKPDEGKEPSATTKVDPAVRDRSRAAFRKGVAQLRAQDWAAARTSFEEAWSLVQHPSILLNLGIARLRTDDPVLAEQDLVRFLSEDSGAGSDELASARDALAEARSKIGTLRVVVDRASARVTVDGQSVAVRSSSEGEGVREAEARLKAGSHRVSVEADGFAPEERAVDVPAKSQAEARFALVAKDGAKDGGAALAGSSASTRAPSDGPSTRTVVGWSLVGASGVALVACGVLGVMAMSRSSAYENRADRASFQDPDVKSQGVAFRTGSDVALVLSLLAGAGAAVLLLTDVGASPRTSSAPAAAPSPSAPTPANGSSRAEEAKATGGVTARIVRLAGGTLVQW